MKRSRTARAFSGSPSWGPGVVGTALSFDGNGERVIVPDDPQLDFAGGITIAAWMRPGDLSSMYVVKKARGVEFVVRRSG